MKTLSANSQLVLGAYALADAHTMTAEQVVALSNGVLEAEPVRASLTELVVLEYAEPHGEGGYRLTRAGIEHTLKLQAALAGRQQ